MSCAVHLKWNSELRVFYKGEKVWRTLLKAIPVPVTNQSRRNVLTSEAESLLDLNEFDRIMKTLSDNQAKNKTEDADDQYVLFEFFKPAVVENKKLTDYSEGALKDLFGTAADKFESQKKLWK